MSGLAESYNLLQNERQRKTALLESFKRQLIDLSSNRVKVKQDIATMRRDIERLRPPSPILQKKYDDLVAREQRMTQEDSNIRRDIENLNLEIKTLTDQLMQLDQSRASS